MRRTFARISCSASSTNRLPGHILLPAPKGATSNGECGAMGVNHLSGRYSEASLKLSSLRPAIQVCKRTTVYDSSRIIDQKKDYTVVFKWKLTRAGEKLTPAGRRYPLSSRDSSRIRAMQVVVGIILNVEK